MTILADADKFALELIQEFGTQTAVYISGSVGEYDPATGRAKKTSTQQVVTCVFLDYTLKADGVTTRFGTSIVQADKQAYVIPPHKTGGTAILPDPNNDQLQVGDVTYSVIGVQEINPTGTDPILYTFYLRR